MLILYYYFFAECYYRSALVHNRSHVLLICSLQQTHKVVRHNEVRVNFHLPILQKGKTAIQSIIRNSFHWVFLVVSSIIVVPRAATAVATSWTALVATTTRVAATPFAIVLWVGLVFSTVMMTIAGVVFALGNLLYHVGRMGNLTGWF